MTRKVGILTGGGDAPGLNAVIRAFVKRGVGQLGWEVVGVLDSFNGLFPEQRRVRALDARAVQGLVARGGTILGTTNKGDPFAFPMPDGEIRDRSSELEAAVAELGLDGLVCIGGDGTQAIAWRLMETRGVPVVGVPKTIDNDLAATDVTFGFWSAVEVATDALDRLHTTADSHDRILFLEVMGRDAGHIALEAGMAGGADVILLPEVAYEPAKVAGKVQSRRAKGSNFSIVVVAEGALPAEPGGGAVPQAERKARLRAGGGAAAIAMKAMGPFVENEMRAVVLGHLQRGGSPSAYDRVLSTRFGVGAADLIADEGWGRMVALRNGAITSVPLAEATARQRLVDPVGELARTAEAVGIELGR